MRELIAARMSRRAFLSSSAALYACAPKELSTTGGELAGSPPPGLEPRLDEHLHLAAGLRAQPLIAWGDPLQPEQTPFDPEGLSAEQQAQRFGANNDFTVYLPLDSSPGARRGLLVVNHEHTNARAMWSDHPSEEGRGSRDPERIRTEMAAHGLSVLEIREEGPGQWGLVPGSRYHRRITAETPFRVQGPAAEHPRLRTEADPYGVEVLGTLHNCSGGVTPWGTVLSGEENIRHYFRGTSTDSSEQMNHDRYGMGDGGYAWSEVDPRFDLSQSPREPNRFGWIVEIDPSDPDSTPVKRTALGRFFHEGATVTLAPDGRVVIYMGDDSRFEYLYRFISKEAYDPAAPEPDLLDEGVLSVAHCREDGTLEWRSLRQGQGPLTPENGFYDQGDVLIEARRAADLLEATPMDRPEGIAVHSSGRVYASLTNNSRRAPAQIDGPNPRAENAHGQIIELIPPVIGGVVELAAKTWRWDLLLLAGPAGSGERYGEEDTSDQWFSCPDNLAFSPEGDLWIGTDSYQEGLSDGIYSCPVAGPWRGIPRRQLLVPAGAEATGLCFSPEGDVLFFSVQHPGEDFRLNGWPDYDPSLPSRAAVVVVTREDGGPLV